MCEKISRYKTQDEAIRRVLSSSRAFGKPMRVYWCDEHECYHGTTKTKGKSMIK